MKRKIKILFTLIIISGLNFSYLSSKGYETTTNNFEALREVIFYEKDNAQGKSSNYTHNLITNPKSTWETLPQEISKSSSIKLSPFTKLYLRNKNSLMSIYNSSNQEKFYNLYNLQSAPSHITEITDGIEQTNLLEKNNQNTKNKIPSSDFYRILQTQAWFNDYDYDWEQFKITNYAGGVYFMDEQINHSKGFNSNDYATISGNISNFKALNFNDLTDYLAIEPFTKVTIYEHINFQGELQTFENVTKHVKLVNLKYSKIKFVNKISSAKIMPIFSGFVDGQDINLQMINLVKRYEQVKYGYQSSINDNLRIINSEFSKQPITYRPETNLNMKIINGVDIETVVTNNTNATQTMTSEEIGYQKMASYTNTWSSTQEMVAEFAQEFQLSILGGFKSTIKIAFKLNFTQGNTWTNSNTINITLPRQNISVPAKTSYIVRGKMYELEKSGNIDIYTQSVQANGVVSNENGLLQVENLEKMYKYLLINDIPVELEFPDIKFNEEANTLIIKVAKLTMQGSTPYLANISIFDLTQKEITGVNTTNENLKISENEFELINQATKIYGKNEYRLHREFKNQQGSIKSKGVIDLSLPFSVNLSAYFAKNNQSAGEGIFFGFTTPFATNNFEQKAQNLEILNSANDLFGFRVVTKDHLQIFEINNLIVNKYPLASYNETLANDQYTSVTLFWQPLTNCLKLIIEKEDKQIFIIEKEINLMQKMYTKAVKLLIAGASNSVANEQRIIVHKVINEQRQFNEQSSIKVVNEKNLEFLKLTLDPYTMRFKISNLSPSVINNSSIKENCLTLKIFNQHNQLIIEEKILESIKQHKLNLTIENMRYQNNYEINIYHCQGIKLIVKPKNEIANQQNDLITKFKIVNDQLQMKNLNVFEHRQSHLKIMSNNQMISSYLDLNNKQIMFECKPITNGNQTNYKSVLASIKIFEKTKLINEFDLGHKHKSVEVINILNGFQYTDGTRIELLFTQLVNYTDVQIRNQNTNYFLTNANLDQKKVIIYIIENMFTFKPNYELATQKIEFKAMDSADYLQIYLNPNEQNIEMNYQAVYQDIKYKITIFDQNNQVVNTIANNSLKYGEKIKYFNGYKIIIEYSTFEKQLEIINNYQKLLIPKNQILEQAIKFYIQNDQFISQNLEEQRVNSKIIVYGFKMDQNIRMLEKSFSFYLDPETNCLKFEQFTANPIAPSLSDSMYVTFTILNENNQIIQKIEIKANQNINNLIRKLNDFKVHNNWQIQINHLDGAKGFEGYSHYLEIIANNNEKYLIQKSFKNSNVVKLQVVKQKLILWSEN